MECNYGHHSALGFKIGMYFLFFFNKNTKEVKHARKARATSFSICKA